MTDRLTDRQTDWQTDGRADIPSYQDVRTHLLNTVGTNYIMELITLRYLLSVRVKIRSVKKNHVDNRFVRAEASDVNVPDFLTTSTSEKIAQWNKPIHGTYLVVLVILAVMLFNHGCCWCCCCCCCCFDRFLSLTHFHRHRISSNKNNFIDRKAECEIRYL